MKCTGSANFAAMATRMPPRALPSSLVMTSPVTPAMLRNTSTWESAFCPTVASSTSRTACGAVGSIFFITRTIFSSSSISTALFCRRPAVSTSSTSISSPRASVSASKARAAASAPDLELIDRRRPERIAGGEHHRAALGVESGRELADGRGLAGAVDADDEHDEGLGLSDRQRLRHRRKDLLHLGGDHRLHLVR